MFAQHEHSNSHQYIAIQKYCETLNVEYEPDSGWVQALENCFMEINPLNETQLKIYCWSKDSRIGTKFYQFSIKKSEIFETSLMFHLYHF